MVPTARRCKSGRFPMGKGEKMSGKAKFWSVYVAISVIVWVGYCNLGDSKYKSKAYNLGSALVWPISIWGHL